MNRNAILKKIQSYKFAAYDMLLYLDTHPTDRTAFKMYQDLVGKTEQCVAEYEANFGPLTAAASANFNTFTWTQSPWPWEKEGNE